MLNISNLPKKVMLVIFLVFITCAPFLGARHVKIQIVSVHPNNDRPRLNYIWQPCSHRYTHSISQPISHDPYIIIILYGPYQFGTMWYTVTYTYLFSYILVSLWNKTRIKFRLSWRVEQMEVSICLKSESVNG